MRFRIRLLTGALGVLALLGLVLVACPSDWPVDDDDSAEMDDDDTGSAGDDDTFADGD